MEAILFFGLCLVFNPIQGSNPGPEVIATKGAIWPRPQQLNTTEQYFIFKPGTFVFTVPGVMCDFLQNSLDRYLKILQQDTQMMPDKLGNVKSIEEDNFIGQLESLEVNLTGLCQDDEYPSLEMDESYRLWVTPNRTELRASTIWGILRGLETFSHLIYLGSDGLLLRLNNTIVRDFPRYKHRGLLIDTSRHFLPLEQIYQTLDAMVFNKMNVLHWHIVDDQSFPYVSKKFPELSDMGAYNRYTKVYNPEDVQNVIEYARVRGVRVMPEFDTPGHTSSWGLSHPEILTPCEIYFTHGPMDPSKQTTFTFLNDLFSEIREVFKDDFLHLGGDEVDFLCWEADNDIAEFMQKQNITSYKGLESYYIQKVVDMAESLNYKSIVWEEVFSNGVKLPNETLVHVWKSDWKDTMKQVTSSGKYALLSSCWYLDRLDSGGDWRDFYLCDPADFGGNSAEQQMILGGEACMWGESVNQYNIISRVWPRASTTAEKLWSAYSSDYDLTEPSKRLEEHTCRMNRRGIGAQPPNGPGYCN